MSRFPLPLQPEYLPLAIITGGAGAACAKMLQESLNTQNDASLEEISLQIVSHYKAQGAHIPGLGHRIYKEKDPRAEKLFTLAEEWQISGPAVSLIWKIAESWEIQTGHHLVVNVDGAQGALLVDMGISCEQAKGLFLIGRSAGLNAHAVEADHLRQAIWFRRPCPSHIHRSRSTPFPWEA